MRVHPFILTSCLVLLVATTAALAQQEPRKPQSAGKLFVTGRVECVYRSEKQLPNEQSDTLYAIEVKPAGSNGEAIPVGKSIFVKTWRPGKRPEGWNGPNGQTEIPESGDIVVVDVTGAAVRLPQ